MCCCFFCCPTRKGILIYIIVVSVIAFFYGIATILNFGHKTSIYKNLINKIEYLENQEYDLSNNYRRTYNDDYYDSNTYNNNYNNYNNYDYKDYQTISDPESEQKIAEIDSDYSFL